MRDDASSGPYKSGFRAIMNLQCAIRQICGGGSTHLWLASEMLCEERSRPFPTGRSPHNSKCRYGERGTADAEAKAQIILDAAKVSAASGGNSEPKQGQRSQSARGFCPRSTMRVPQPDIIEHFGNADAVPQPPEQCLSRQVGIVRCCLYNALPPFNLPLTRWNAHCAPANLTG